MRSSSRPRSPVALPARRLALVAFSVGLLVGCATRETVADGLAAPDPLQATLWVATEGAELIHVRADAPQRVLARRPLQGLAAGERLVGMDFRRHGRGLYALSSLGRLYTVDLASGRLARVGTGPAVTLEGTRFGVAFDPLTDRLRVVSDQGQNLRVHPDSGVLAAIDQPLHYGAGDPQQSSPSRLVSVACSPPAEPLPWATTHYAIDQAAATLVVQGTLAGEAPSVSPNQGWLRTVGPLGTGALEDAVLDIPAAGGVGLAALQQRGQTRLHSVDLATGQATLLGRLGEGRKLWAMAAGG